MEIPDCLEAELSKNKNASEKFQSLSPSHKMEYLKWITEAKTEQTRTKRASKAVDMILRN